VAAQASSGGDVNHDEIVAYCLAKPGAVRDTPWENDLVAKVGGKIFAFLGSTSVGLKCGRTAEEAAELRTVYPESVTIMAYIGRYGWNTVQLDGTPGDAPDDDELRELVDASYADVVARLPKKLRP
jgi:predicted DNA-binding protein (MmcQ/YjbR family)